MHTPTQLGQGFTNASLLSGWCNRTEMLEWVLLALILIGSIAYIFIIPKDVDPYFMEHQASISTTKQPGESAVFRSLANEHGRALLGSMHPLNQFKLKHVWEEAENFKILYVTKTGKTCKVDNFVGLVAQVQSAIAHFPPNCEIPISFGVSIEALIALFAVVLSGRTPVLASSTVQDGDDADEETVDEDFESHAILRQAEFTFAQESSGIYIKKDEDTSLVIPIMAPQEKANTLNVKTVDTPADFTVMRIGDHTKIKQRDLGVAVAAQLTALGAQHRWGSNDSVFMAPGPLTTYAFTAMLTALSAKSQLVFAELGPMVTATTVLERVKPTVLVSDDESMRSLSKQVQDFQLLDWLRYGVRRLRLARGSLTAPGMMPGFNSIRLIHTATGPDPFEWLDNSEVSNLRVLSGCQVIHVFTPDDGIALSESVVGDYRTGKLPGVVLGPPLPGIEMKKSGEKLYVRHANYDDWQQIAVDGAKLSKDGCLYIPEKRKDFSDYYYYTGELK